MIKNIKINKKVLAALFLSSSLTLCGCEAKEAECDIDVRHAHLYERQLNSGEYGDIYLHKYMESEIIRDYYFDRKDDYIEISDEEALKLQTINDYEHENRSRVGFIIKIDENKYLFNCLEDRYQNYYDYKCVEDVYYPIGADLAGLTWETETYYSKDPNHRYATGEKRLNYYVFYGYNLIDTDNGYELIKSGEYYTLDDLVANCEYIDDYCAVLRRTEKQDKIDSLLEKNPKVKIRK